MKLAVMFSGGKDSVLALMKAKQKDEVVCLISVISRNRESYMFHTPNIGITELQADSMGLPLVKRFTEGEKERELEDLKEAIREAKERFVIEGIVTGGVESVYQAERFQRICNELGLWCFSPLWMKDQKELLREVIGSGIRAIISGVFASQLDKEWLGREIDNEVAEGLFSLEERHGISPAGEGGEIETTVLDAPFFRKRIEIMEAEKEKERDSGVFLIKKARLAEK